MLSVLSHYLRNLFLLAFDIRDVSIFVNNTNPGDKDKVRITKLGHTQVSAEVFS